MKNLVEVKNTRNVNDLAELFGGIVLSACVAPGEPEYRDEMNTVASETILREHLRWLAENPPLPRSSAA